MHRQPNTNAPKFTNRFISTSIASLLIITACGSASALGAENTLMLKAGSVDLSTLTNAKHANQAQAQRFPSRMVIVLDQTITPAIRQQIESTGTVFLDYLPEHAYIVDLSNARIANLRSLKSITHIVEFNDAWKIDPQLATRQVQTESRKLIAAQGKLAAQVYLFSNENIADALKDIAKHSDVEIVRNELQGDRSMIEVIGTQAAIESLAKIDGIQWIESATEITLRNSTDRWIVQSNVNGSFPVYDAGIHGENQLVAVMDGKVNVNHCSFTDPEGDPIGDDHRKIQAYNTSLGSDFHGTHVAGTVLGDNNVNDNTRGVAYEARLIFDTTPSFSFSAMNAKLQTHYSQGAAIHTNSWGDDGTTAYTGLARSIDTFSHDNDDNLIIFAVTNTNSLKTPENAKNCLAVGASQDASNQGRILLWRARPNRGRPTQT